MIGEAIRTDTEMLPSFLHGISLRLQRGIRLPISEAALWLTIGCLGLGAALLVGMVMY